MLGISPARISRSGFLPVAALMLAAVPGLAQAQTGQATGSPSVDLLLVGNISARCSIGGGRNLDLGELSSQKQAVARFDLGCNLPFQLNFRSAFGGMAHVTQPGGEGPYEGLLPYNLGVTIPALSPDPLQLQSEFTSSQMVAGAVLDSGEAIARGGGEIRLRTQLPAGKSLLAGRYADSITITITPRV